ncbi:MAG: peptidoglycan-binding domain-containing protein [Hyphomonas sp.]|uniref:peptidoglycan-binding domain-containing protein n=1 Tax=Hyphomonas sp. TaxID=87 RepID=UPI0035287019
MKKLLALSVASTALAGMAFAQGSADYPPDADAGSCFARVLIPESTEIQTEQVVDRPEASEIKVIPASYETVTEQVLVKEASVRYNVIPAEYETVTEQVIESPERTETVVIPAEYETYTEQVLVRPAYTTWKPGAGLYGRSATSDGTGGVATGELLCRVEVPAQYDTVTRTRIKTPERTETKVIPATYKTVTREVVKTPAQVVEETVPAVYDTITVQKLVSAAREETIVIPATYKTVEKRVVTGGGGLEWREVLCDTNASPAKISEVQQALSAKGYTLPVDGAFGPATLRAMEEYQRANGLPVGYLTVSTVESLGVSPR